MCCHCYYGFPEGVKRGLFTLGIIVCSLLARGQQREYKIWFDQPNDTSGMAVWLKSKSLTNAGDVMRNPDRQWESRSLPLGNGSLGANVMGSVNVERITLNEKTLWRGGPNTAKGAACYWNANKQSAHVLKDIRQAFAEGDFDEAARLTRRNFNGWVPYESCAEEPSRFGSFTTMGEFHVRTGIDERGIEDYKRVLSLDSAMTVVRFRKDGVNYRRECFISYPDQVMVIRFSADRRGRQHLVFTYTPNPVSSGEIRADGKRAAIIYTGQLDNNHMKYAVAVRAVLKGGSVSNTCGELRVEGADEVVFLVSAATDYKMNFDPDFDDPGTYVGNDPVGVVRQRQEKVGGKGYERLLRRHYRDYSALFDRVKLRLNPAVGEVDLPTNERLERYRQGQPDPYLEELYYQFGRYLLIASSRTGTMPANLQGLWHNNVDGPWRVDYHNNINLQMNYWPACPTNLSECMLPLVDFIRTLQKPGAVTAKAYFGARGWTTSISGNIFGFTSPLSSEDMTWNFCPMAGPWLATHVWEYYDFTRDRDFLREIGYDIIKNSARFTVDYLWHRPDGSYTAAPSTSPEHGPVDEGATFVHAVAREILMDAVEASRVLDVDGRERAGWERVLERLVPYRVGRYGQLMEWARDIDDPKDAHRHVNHLFGLHPGHTISPVSTPELARAARVVLEHRGDFATGWSMGWKLNQWARLHDGNHAYTLYRNLLKNGTLDNLWDTHPPFQIDGNFGGAAGVTEMLLQSHMGFIHLLPALPDTWQEGEIAGLRARGGFEVSIRWKNGCLTEASIVSKAGTLCSVRYGDRVFSFPTHRGKSYRVVLNPSKDGITLEQ